MEFKIPDPVIELDICTETINRELWTFRYTAQVMVGGVTVFKRVYHDDDTHYDENHVYDGDDVRDKVLRAFGERMRDLLQENQ